ncbi:LysR substrate-binding domain-containing protein [Burkholderia vietnamiensis]|uniref:LysR substrate-binding domain-containing protein n=1 Tax=Burkholderia vietnamiensis TaxID=60552 RepID=UPI00075BE651|nr:LysR substrate-binding domain-containing protein [Burkholderia vietnamiensis]
MDPTLRQLQAFVLSYRFGALTRAAEHMFITQSAVSVLIQQLEEGLGVKLFDRTTRALRPTVAATDLLPTAERMLRDLNALKTGAKGISQRTRGHLSFAATPSVAAAILPRLLSEYQRRYPDIRVSMHDIPPDRLIDAVLGEEVEFSIGTVGTAPEGISLRPLLRDRLSVICTTDSSLAKKRAVRWSDVFPLRCITVRQGSGIRDLVESAARQLGISFDPAFEVAYMSSALAMASAGLGVALLPAALLDSFAYTNLVARPLTQPEITRDINLICHAQRTLSPAAEGFLELWYERVEKKDGAAAPS